MKTDNYLRLSNFVALLAAIICVITGGLSYHAYLSARKVQEANRQSVESLQQDVLRLDARFAKLDDNLAALQDRSGEDFAHRNAKKTESPHLTGRKETPASQSHTLKRLEQILDSTGLKQLAENGEVNPEIFQKIYDEYVYRDQIASHHEQLLQKNRLLHGMDDQNYDEQLMSLYQRARILRGPGKKQADSANAFGEMLEKYPDAYATGMVIAERAFQSAFRRNISEVEDYYTLLRGNDNFLNIVTDRGIEAVPNIQYHLVRQYIRDGRVEDAQVLLNSLEENYADSFIRARRQGHGPRWQPVPQVTESLYQQIK